jgi:hypothetical protein
MRRPTNGQATAQRNMTTLYQNAHSSERVSVTLLKNLDIAVVVIGSIVALLLGAPAFGVIVGAVGWILQRVVAVLDRRAATKFRDPHTQVGFRLFESFGRVWLLAGAIVFAGVVGDRQDGLTAAIVIFAAYSVAFAIRLMSGPPPEREQK